MRFRGTALCVILLAATSPLAAQKHFPGDDSIRSIVRSVVETRGNVGVVVGLLEADGSRRVITVGDAPYDGSTLFEIGSITKVFTGILLADLVERGAVRLDQPLAELLPNVPVPTRGGRQITLLNLATHTSGLPRMPGNFAPADPGNPYEDYTVEQMYEFLRTHQLQRDIGEEPLYSNIGAALLGHALALRAGMSYEELVTTRILEPLGMRGTMITIPEEWRSRFAPGHDAQANPVSSWELTAFAGAGALRSGADDMLTFLAANLSPPDSTVLGRALRRAQTPHPVGRARGGLHWGISRTPFGRTFIGHGGGTGGFSTYVGFDPERRIGVVVLGNISGAPALYRIGPHLLDARQPLSTARIARHFTMLATVLATLFVLGVFFAWRRAGATRWKAIRAAIVSAIGAAAWLFATHALARYGLLRFDTAPPTMALLFLALVVLAAGLGSSRVGARLAALPLAALVAVQSFRLPLELMMHDAYEAGLMPVQMSYSGLNFDIVTGITAIIVAALVATGRAGVRTVRAWNLLGSLLLLNIIVISLLSAPTPFRVFATSPPNTWVTAPPYVWLPTVMVAFALLGHIVLFRRLRQVSAQQ